MTALRTGVEVGFLPAHVFLLTISASLNLLQSTLAVGIHTNTRVIRCYCTTDECLGTRNECISYFGCYTLHSTYYCINNATEQSEKCSEPGVCCYSDYCQTYPLKNGFVIPHIGSPVDVSTRNMIFRIAVVAVPITGAIVLIILIMLAIKFLRDEEAHHRILLSNKMDTLQALHRGCQAGYCHLARTHKPLPPLPRPASPPPFTPGQMPDICCCHTIETYASIQKSEL